MLEVGRRRRGGGIGAGASDVEGVVQSLFGAVQRWLGGAAREGRGFAVFEQPREASHVHVRDSRYCPRVVVVARVYTSYSLVSGGSGSGSGSGSGRCCYAARRIVVSLFRKAKRQVTASHSLGRATEDGRPAAAHRFHVGVGFKVKVKG